MEKICDMEKEEKKLLVSEDTRKRLKPETAAFYYERAEKRLEHTAQLSNDVTNRAYILLSALVTVLTGFSWILNRSEDWMLFTASVIGMVVSIICISLLFLKVICIHTIWLAGRKPSSMKINAFIDYYAYYKKDQYVNVIADELQAAEDAINNNEKDINKRVRWYGISLKIILIGIIILSVLLILRGFNY